MKSNCLSKLSSNFLKIVKEVGRLADQKNIKAYLVGGVVRDLILKRKIDDLDFVIESDAIEFAQELALKKGLRIIVYQPFKTATILWEGGLEIDFATARKETYAFSGALPSVQESNLKDDLFRRDFTINALALSINTQTFGHLEDFNGGMDDLKNKAIRIMHEKSFMDDPTRILRAVRFAVRLGFRIEKTTLNLLQCAVQNRALSHVKLPRLFQEFRKNLSEKNLVDQIQEMNRLNILRSIHPQLKPKIDSLKMIEGYVVKSQNGKGAAQWLWAMVGITQKLSADELKSFLQKFQINKSDEQMILESQQIRKVLAQLNKPLLKPSKIYMILSPFQPLTVELFGLLAQKKNQRIRIKQYLEKYRFCALTVNGHDLKKLGYSEGKDIKTVFNKMLLQKIDGIIKTKKDELKYAASLL